MLRTSSEDVISVGRFTLQMAASGEGIVIRSTQWPGLSLGPLRPAITLDGVRHTPAALTLAPTEHGARLTTGFGAAGASMLLSFSAADDSSMEMACELSHHSPRPAVLNHVALLELVAPTGRAAFGEGEASARICEECGLWGYVRGIAEPAPTPALNQGQEPVEIEQQPMTEGASRTMWELYNPTVGQAFLVGFDWFERWIGMVQTGFSASEGMTHWALAFDGGDLAINPGENLPLESVVWMMDPDPWRLLERWGDHVQRKHDLRPPAASPVTWCSWYPYRLTVSEEAVLANARIAEQRLKALGLSTMQVDLGWEAGWLPSEYRENDQFPHGLKWLSDRLAEHGFRLGIWNAPFCVSEFQSEAREHPDWLLSDDSGRPAAEGTWFWEPHGNVHVVDLTHPGTQAWVRANTTGLAERGVSYLKCDFLGAVHNGALRRRHNPRIVGGGGLEAGRLGCRIIRDAMYAVHPAALILNCNGVEATGLGLFSLLYTTYDTGNTGYVGWRHLRQVYTAVACHLYKQGRWGVIQPSCLCVGPPGTLEEARVRATATFLCGGEVDISDDLTQLQEERWQVLLTTMPPLSKPAKPIDLFDAGADYPSVWHLPVETDWDQWDLIGLFNFDLPPGRYDYGSPPRSFQVPLDRLGRDSAATYWAYEFWSGAYLGEVTGALESMFFGPAVQLIVLRRARTDPWVVGTGFHQSAGGELRAVTWDRSTSELRGEVHRPSGARGSITIVAPGGMPPVATVAGQPAPVLPAAGGSWVLPIVCRQDVTPWAVHFQE